jgi:hypothetical protein
MSGLRHLDGLEDEIVAALAVDIGAAASGADGEGVDGRGRLPAGPAGHADRDHDQFDLRALGQRPFGDHGERVVYRGFRDAEQGACLHPRSLYPPAVRPFLHRGENRLGDPELVHD